MKNTTYITLLFIFSVAFTKAQSIDNAEYFFDHDPGIGNGIQLSIAPQNDSIVIPISITSNGLNEGAHQVFFRTKDSQEKWSLYKQQAFYIYSNLVAAEYFIDHDPGIGNGIPISISPQSDSSNFSFTIQAAGLSEGWHLAYVRSKNSVGAWSFYDKRAFYILPEIVAAEYFIDEDPGIGNGIAISISSQIDSILFSLSINTSVLRTGNHSAFIRTKNSLGIWSLYQQQKFYIQEEITAAEYFIDTDPGLGNAIPISVSAHTDSITFSLSINTNGLSSGNHSVFIRTKNSLGNWSLSKQQKFYIQDEITAAEYFIDSDPGIGNGSAISLQQFTDSALTDTTLQIGNLNSGQHTLYYRVKDESSNWSLYDTLNFSICDSIGLITSIIGDTNILACAHQNGITYSIDTVLNADYYVWHLPPGATVVSGDSTTSITVNYSPNSTSGFVTVAGGFGQCVGTETSLQVNFKPIPSTQICRATIDSSAQKTLLEWQKPIESYVDGYVIYRNIFGIYTAIDTVSNSLYSSYLDIGSTPNLQAEQYKIAVLDSCGNIGDTSGIFQHQTIYLYGFISAGSIAKLYWTDYIGITDSSRFYRVLYDPTGNGAFSILKDSIPFTTTNWTDQLSGTCPACRYVVEMVYNSNCSPSIKSMTGLSTTRSNIKNKNLLPPDPTGSISETKSDIGFKIYPNPAKEFVTIEVDASDAKYEVSLYDILGKEILKSVASSLKNQSILQLPLKGIARGLYFVKIKTTERELLMKLNIE